MAQHQPKNPSEIVCKARQGFNKGLTKNLAQRKTNLKNFLKFVVENEESIIATNFEDLRQHREEVRLQIVVTINHVKMVIDNLTKWARPERRPKRWVDALDGVYVYRDPLGVVLVVGTWNMALLTLAPLAGAIAGGNCVVIKPSHNSPRFGQLLEKVLPKYLDPECFPVFMGDIDETNRLLEERFDYIYYTGSTAVGRIVHKAATKFLTPTTLQLGGKNPVYVDASADMVLTSTRLMWGKFFNSGQICLSPDYVLCSKPTQEKLVLHAKAALDRFHHQDPNCCPIVNDHHFKRLQNLLRGLEIALGGRVDPLDNHIEPTVAVNVPPDHPIMQEEVFGPILPIVTVDDHKQAVDFINRREKPLTMYVFTKRSSVKDYFLENTSSGSVVVNDNLMQLVTESLPFGGVGFSGMGRYKDKDSFDTFVHRKAVLVKNTCWWVEKLHELRYRPFSAGKMDAVAFLYKYRGGFSWIWAFYVGVFAVGGVVVALVFYLVQWA